MEELKARLREAYQVGLETGNDPLCDLARDVALKMDILLVEIVR